MAHTPPNHSAPWTPEEESKLDRLVAEGSSLRDIAKALGRTRGAVTSKAYAMKSDRHGPASRGLHAPKA